MDAANDLNAPIDLGAQAEEIIRAGAA